MTQFRPDSDRSVVGLEDVDPAAFRRILAEQRDAWFAALDWDLSEINDTLHDAVRTGSISGSAAMDGDRVAGFGFFTIEEDRCLLGDAFVSADFRDTNTLGLVVDDLLARANAAGRVGRVENHTICLDPEGSDFVFEQRGFEAHEREYLARDAVADDTAPIGHSRVRLRPWDDADFGRVAEVVYQAYRGTVDAKLNCQYRSRDGCTDLLDALTQTVWCGRFDPDCTRVAEDAETHRVCGVAVATRISDLCAHLGQVSVLPVYQGEGIGRALVRAVIDAAARAGIRRCSLAVTSANRTAAHLYRDLGFRTERRFRVYTRERGSG